MQRALDGGLRSAAVVSATLVVVLLIVTSLPYLYAWRSAPPGVLFTGLMFDVPDHAQYWSWITASRDGLFISNTMTPEPNPAVFMNPTMWLLSRLQSAFDLSFAMLFQWWRIAAVLLLVPAIVGFVKVLVREPERRPMAVILCLLGSGVGWIWVVVKKVLGTADVAYPHDLYTVEPNTFWAALSYPYLALAQGLILIVMVSAWLAHRGAGWRACAAAGAGALALSLSHAYDLLTVYAVLGLFAALEWYRTRRMPRGLVAAGVAIGACSAPAALYYHRLTSGDPLWQSILSQYSNAGVWTPPHLHLVVLMGIPFLLAVLAVLPRSPWTDERRFLTVWVATGLVLIYLPVVFQIKLLSAWQFPIALLAVHAWYERIVPALPRTLPRAAATAALLLAVSATNLYLFAWRFVELRRHAPPYFLHHEEHEALQWLAANASPSDVVIAPIELGQFVPNHGRTRAYLAHWAMTNRFFERRDNVDRFFSPEAAHDWRKALLQEEGVTLVLRSRWSGPPAPYDFSHSDAFELMFFRPEAQIYRVRATVSQPSTTASR
jgi:hypothetical protein